MHDKLGLVLTPIQEQICHLTLVPPYRVLVKSGHNVGKTHVLAALISWRYDNFNPGVVLSTAPTYKQVCDVLWGEIRLQRARAGLGGFTGRVAPSMYDGPDHWAQGLTANVGGAFQGRHRECMFFGYDEAIDIDPIFFEAADTMFTGGPGNAFVAIFNPTNPASRVYGEEHSRDLDGNPKWHVVEMSCLDHPNIIAELAGETDARKLPCPNAVRLSQVETWIADECDELPADEREATDLEWPPGSGVYYRPGPVFEARVLGRWPSSAIYGVWSDHRWAVACKEKEFRPDIWLLPTIGCDVARFGDDDTAIGWRHTNTAMGFERHNGWDEVRTAARLIELAHELAAWLTGLHDRNDAPIDAHKIPINVDEPNVGGGVVTLLRRQGYAVRGCISQSAAMFPDRYPSLRDELWFSLVERARHGKLDLSRIRKKDREKLKVEAMLPMWEPTTSGQRQVESKKVFKKRLPSIGSPDGMDALNLTFYEAGPADPIAIAQPTRGLKTEGQSGAERRKWFGR